MLGHYYVKPVEWDDEETYTTIAASYNEAVERFLDDCDYDAEYDGVIMVVFCPLE